MDRVLFRFTPLASVLFFSLVTNTSTLEWTLRNPAGPQFVRTDVAFGNGRFVSIGTGTMEISDDGRHWQVLTNRIQGASLAFGAGMFTLVTDKGGLMTSADGTEWTTASTGATNRLIKVKFESDSFRAWQADGLTFSSPDGKVWTQPGEFQQFRLRPHAFGNGRFVMIGPIPNISRPFGLSLWPGLTNLGTIEVSTDRGNWLQTTNWVADGYHDRFIPVDITYGGNLFVLVGITSRSGSGIILTSPDGVQWTQRVEPYYGEGLRRIVYAGGKFVAFDNFAAPVLVTSSDGISWPDRVSFPVRHVISGIAHGDGIFLGVGWPSDDPFPKTGAAVLSTDGVEWADANQLSGRFTDVACGGGRFVAAGWPAAWSTDGVSWNPVVTNIAWRLQSVAYGKQMFVGVGGEYILSSTNGIDWVVRGRVDADFTKVIFANETFVAVNPGIIRSEDGIRWVVPENANAYRAVSIAYGGGHFLAVGNSGVLRSTDGTRWEVIPVNPRIYFTDLTYGDGQFIALGSTKPGETYILTSTDGDQWNVGANIPGGNRIAYGGGLIAVTAADFSSDPAGAIWTSPDATQWDRFSSAAALVGVQFCRERFFAVGYDGAIWESTPIPVHPVVRFKPGSPQIDPGGGLRLVLESPPGQTVILEASSDLKVWAPVVTHTATTTQIEFVDSSARELARRFYRGRISSGLDGEILKSARDPTISRLRSPQP